MFSRITRFAAAFTLSFLSTVAAESAGRAPSFGLDVTVEASAGLSGGAKRGQTLHGMALAYAEWAKPEQPADGLNWSGYVSALALTGQGPTGRFLEDALGASSMEGYQSVRLYTWWAEAGIKDWSLRGGVLLADEEFAGTEAGGNFQNSAFGWPTFISANTVNAGPAFFVAAPGLRLERSWGETAVWRVGLYDGDTFDSPAGDPHVTRHGLHYRVGGEQGWFVISEANFAPAGGPTRYTLGAWLHTAAFADLTDATRTHGSNHGVYAAIERTLAGESGKAGNLEAFVRGGFSPADRNAVSWALDAGLAWTGPLAGRPADVFALGLAHAKFSSRFADSVLLADPAAARPDFEQVIEASYTIPLSDHFTLQPDVQYIRHPGGSTALRNATVFQLRLNASY
jgi:porin